MRYIWLIVLSLSVSDFFLEFATDPETRAVEEKDKKYSLWTSYFIKCADLPIDLASVTNTVRDRMRRDGRRQRLWSHHCTTKPIYLSEEVSFISHVMCFPSNHHFSRRIPAHSGRGCSLRAPSSSRCSFPCAKLSEEGSCISHVLCFPSHIHYHFW